MLAAQATSPPMPDAGAAASHLVTVGGQLLGNLVANVYLDALFAVCVLFWAMTWALACVGLRQAAPGEARRANGITFFVGKDGRRRGMTNKSYDRAVKAKRSRPRGKPRGKGRG